MTIDWVTVGIAVASALVTALVHKVATAPTTPAQAATPSASSGGLFHGGLLHRLQGQQSSSGSSSSQSNSATPSATGHPILDAIVSTLQGVVSQNPSLLTSLSGAGLCRMGPGGPQAWHQLHCVGEPKGL